MRSISQLTLLSLLLTALALTASPPAQAQEGTFLVFFDQDRLPEAVESGDDLGKLFARSLQARYEGERPVEAVLIGALFQEGEIVDEFRSRRFEVEPGRVRFPDTIFGRLFPDDYFDRAFPDSAFDVYFPDSTFDVYFPDSTFMPGDVQGRLERRREPALFVALVPADRDLREKTASRAAVLVMEGDCAH